MSDAEWKKFKDAVLKAKSYGFFEDLSQTHANVEEYAHNNPRFLPWHRMFLLYFEKILQFLTKDESLAVPYWDWTIDSDDPSKSPIFHERYWGINECFELNYPTRHCLKRNDNEIDPFYTKYQINRLINKKSTYDEFREALEIVQHAIVHFNVGGSDGDMSMMYSTNDPIFWHHHSFIDYLWHKKQKKKPQEEI